MPRLRRIILLTFTMSLAVTPAQRAVYFFARVRLGFSDAENLALALASGTAYVLGALCSHGVSRRLGERKVLQGAIVGAIGLMVVTALRPTPALLFVTMTLLGVLLGGMWPIIESYVGAGQGPQVQARAIGQFNMAWSTAVPLGYAVSGLIIEHWAPGLFWLAAALSIGGFVLSFGLARRPEHLPADHPERPGEDQVAYWRGLLASARSLMVSTYALMWILNALFPRIFEDVGVPVVWATVLAALLDIVRLAMFALLKAWPGWHGRRRWLLASTAAIPAGYFLIIGARNLGMVLAGELVFGAAVGVVYFSALYYAIVVKNASVDAGGGHEGLIGSGFTIGPLAGLAAEKLTPVLGGVRLLGQLVATGPMILVCSILAVRPLLRRAPWRERRVGPPAK